MYMHTHTIRGKKKKRKSAIPAYSGVPIDRLRKVEKGEWGEPVGCGVRPNCNVDLGMVEANNIGFGSAGDAAAVAVAFRDLW